MNDSSQDIPIGRPRVLVPEKLSPDGLALLRTSADVDEKKGLSPEDLLGIIEQYDSLLIRSETKVTEQLLQAAKRLKVVARAGVGVDNVDLKAATKLGIIVVNSPTGNTGAAAEHTIALIMALARNLPEACSALKDKKWERRVGIEVKNKVLAIIGLGKGRRTPSFEPGFPSLLYDPAGSINRSTQC
jgi:D-3-phosphoglycerate dehydrogenase / 2-oxoglutarate reductase